MLKRLGGSMPLPPPLTEEQRRQALEKAAVARRRRADLKDQLKSGRTTLKELLGRTDDEVVGKMKVSTVLESLPGVGRVRARKLMERLDISESRRMRGLGAKQKENLLTEFARR
jgi:predicted N-acetyltransferase YhbS